jgi:Domain of unknown function (DUF3859)
LPLSSYEDTVPAKFRGAEHATREVFANVAVRGFCVYGISGRPRPEAQCRSHRYRYLWSFSPGKVIKRETMEGTNGITLREGRTLLSQTETVPGVVGTTFGIQYVLRGPPKGKVVKLTNVTRFPPSGMVNDKGQKLDKTQFDWNETIGNTEIRTYTLDHAWEVVPGDWTMEFYYDGRKIGEKRFTVTAPKN